MAFYLLGKNLKTLITTLNKYTLFVGLIWEHFGVIRRNAWRWKLLTALIGCWVIPCIMLWWSLIRDLTVFQHSWFIPGPSKWLWGLNGTHYQWQNSKFLKININLTIWGLPVCSVVRICLPMQETQEIWVGSLGAEDALDEERAIHSSSLA